MTDDDRQEIKPEPLYTRKSSCMNCRFIKTTVSKIIGGSDELECRRYPPQVISEYGTALFPVVFPGTFCGEYKGLLPVLKEPALKERAKPKPGGVTWTGKKK